jgi:hypothetical protein
MRTFFAPVAAVLLAAAACSSSTSTSSSTSSSSSGGASHVIRASDYDTHCATAADCAVVSDGDLCGCPGCGTAAINKADVSRFESDAQNLRSQCAAPQQACPASCFYSEATCSAGACGVCHLPGCTDGGVPDGGSDAAHD